MLKKGLFFAFLLCFYMVIILYVFFAIIHIGMLENYLSAMVYESLGFILLVYFVLGNMFLKPIKHGYFVPIICVTVIYTIVLDVLNIAFVITMPHVFFTLANFILLFIYCIITIPMYIMGRR